MRAARDLRIAGLGNTTSSIPDILFPAPSLFFLFPPILFRSLGDSNRHKRSFENSTKPVASLFQNQALFSEPSAIHIGGH